VVSREPVFALGANKHWLVRVDKHRHPVERSAEVGLAVLGLKKPLKVREEIPTLTDGPSRLVRGERWRREPPFGCCGSAHKLSDLNGDALAPDVVGDAIRGIS
jgi:hypothetical protein